MARYKTAICEGQIRELWETNIDIEVEIDGRGLMGLTDNWQVTDSWNGRLACLVNKDG